MTKYWLGKKRSLETVEKMRQGNLGHHRSVRTEFKKGMVPWNKGLCTGKYKRKKWYAEIHMWLKYHYGKAWRCQNKNCSTLCNIFQWAKLRRVEYEKRRKNFIMLCQSCHQRYDRNIT